MALGALVALGESSESHCFVLRERVPKVDLISDIPKTERRLTRSDEK